MTSALISARDARIDADGAVLLDSLSFEADGARVGLLGAFGPLFRLFSSRAELSRGSVDVLGRAARLAVATNVLGLAPLDPVLPERWTVADYLVASAGLIGLSRRASKGAAADALETVEVRTLAKRKIATLSAVERRIALIAHALLGAPQAILIERPLAQLSDDDAGVVRIAVERAAVGRRLLVMVDAPAGLGPELNLLSAMDRVAVLEAGAIVAVGPPSEALAPSPRCVVRTGRHAPALIDALGRRGLRVEPTDEAGAEAARLVVFLPAGATAMTIVEAALEVEAPLLELVPVGLEPPG